MSPLTDTHTHLYLPEFDNERGLLIDDAFNKNISRFFLPNINSETIEKYFTGTPSRVQGIGIFDIAEEAIRMHQAAFSNDPVLL